MSFLMTLLLAALLTGADQVTKIAASARLSDGPIVLWDGVFELRYYINHGAAFSMMQDQFTFFYIGTGIVLAVLLYCVYRMPRTKKYLPLRITLAFLMAGAVGNLIDRIALHGVRDFLYFSLIDFPIFNVADIYVTCSAIVLALLILFYYKNEKDFDFLKIRPVKKEEK